MTIEIDDSGTGDLIGSAFILFWRKESNILIKKEVPLELYQSSDFNNKTQTYIQDLFIEAFKELEVSREELIKLCTGSCFNLARQFLNDEQYNYEDAKIVGYLQDQVEQTYLDHIIEEYGVPAKILSKDSGKKRFFALYYWIIKDFPRRIKYVKSGFEKWQTKWEHEAQLQWMRKMVITTDPYKSSYFNDKSKKKKFPHKKKENRLKNNDDQKKTKNPKFFNSHKKKFEKKNKNSSTDPDPRKKLY